MTKINLQGKCILVTRPQPLGEILCQEINRANGKAIYLPTIEIHPPADPTLYQHQLSKIDNLDWLIFISPQAIYTIRDLLHQKWMELPGRTLIAAIGGGTAKALEQAGFHVDAFPPEDMWSSEGLLALPEFQQVSGKKIALMRGEGGREYLEQSLRNRGAIVSQIVVYRRVKPDLDTDVYIKLIVEHAIDYIVATSSEGLRNLIEMLLPAWAELHAINLVVISHNMQVLAAELGFEKIILAKNPSRSAIMDALNQSIATQSNG
jgi:uroporphyrinogen-III synthase